MLMKASPFDSALAIFETRPPAFLGNSEIEVDTCVVTVLELNPFL